MRSDSLGIWRDSEGRGWRGGEVTPSPVCVRNAVSHATLGRVPRAPIGMDPAPNRFPRRPGQGLERNLPSLAAEAQLLPGLPGSLVLSANLQV